MNILARLQFTQNLNIELELPMVCKRACIIQILVVKLLKLIDLHYSIRFEKAIKFLLLVFLLKNPKRQSCYYERKEILLLY